MILRALGVAPAAGEGCRSADFCARRFYPNRRKAAPTTISGPHNPAILRYTLTHCEDAVLQSSSNLEQKNGMGNPDV